MRAGIPAAEEWVCDFWDFFGWQRAMTTVVAAVAQASAVTAQQRGGLGRSSGWGGADGSGPTSTYISRSVWRVNSPRRQFVGVRVRRVTRCEASGRGFDDQFGRMAQQARRKAGEVFEDVKRKTVDFNEKNDVQGKVWMPTLVWSFFVDCSAFASSPYSISSTKFLSLTIN